MNPLVPPMIFYWIGVCDAVNTVVPMVAIFFAVIFAIGGLICYGISTDMCDGDDKTKTCRRGMKLLSVSFVIGLIGAILYISVPKKETCYQMLVAQYVTPDNLDAAREVFSEARTAVKEDVIDVIEAIQTKGEQE